VAGEALHHGAADHAERADDEEFFAGGGHRR
jgi:hypothetical protein